MLRSRRGAAMGLVLSMSFAVSAPPASAGIDVQELEAAVLARAASEDAARARLQGLLAREDVRDLVRGAGLDLRQAEAAVATLQGDELRLLADQAAVAEAERVGGQVIQIGLVTALLIIIVVILLVD
jgi:hypothetical protein